ncbi:hypothetical protein FA95DRAFT_1468051, partial [Auriscalpium vulgare]
FQSVISTRGQKARAAQQLVTPPLSEDTASLAESASAPAHMTRASSRLEKGRAKGKAVSASAEPEPRVLRGRPSQRASTAAEERKTKSQPKGKGKAELDPSVPHCVTCTNVLPIISLDEEIVWGDFEGTKKDHQECP